MQILTNDTVEIIEVWSDNLEKEFEFIRNVVDDFPYVAMDTEFPGTVIRPGFRSSNTYEAYQHMKENVDVLKIIQLGLTFSDELGNLPTSKTGKHCVWQFNFREFDPQRHCHVQQSVAMLRQAGINFQRNNEKGVDAMRFGELLMSSGVVMRDPKKEVHWLTFHGSYDFALLIRILKGGTALPKTQEEFFKLLRTYFPVIYDLKHVARFCGVEGLRGGLKRVADSVGAQRVGEAHLAGSDSLFTLCAFMKVKDLYFAGKMPEQYSGVLFGL